MHQNMALVRKVAAVIDAGAVARRFETMVMQAGGLHLLFVNAGIGLDQRLVEHSDAEAFVQTLNVNLTGTCHCARLAIPHVCARWGGGG